MRPVPSASSVAAGGELRLGTRSIFMGTLMANQSQQCNAYVLTRHAASPALQRGEEVKLHGDIQAHKNHPPPCREKASAKVRGAKSGLNRDLPGGFDYFDYFVFLNFGVE